MSKIKLSIIIPAYNAEPYIEHLITRLKPQITDEVEVLVIDDGSKFPYLSPYDWVKVTRKENGGVSSARNKGLDIAKGEYIAFIDADDLVSENYVDTILGKIKAEHFDYCYLSWKTFGGKWNYQVRLRSVEDKFPPFNLCVWNRIYKRSMIGDIRFNKNKKVAEDAQFIREVSEDGKKKAYIADYMYYYRDTPNSLTKRCMKGEIDFNRIVYYYSHISHDMTWLKDEISSLNEIAEVIVMTNQNDLKTLESVAMIIPPQRIKATEARGEYTNMIELMPKAIKTQVVIYTNWTDIIGGIETFTYSFCKRMTKYYDIIVLYNTMHPDQLERLSQVVQCIKYNEHQHITCDTLIMNRILDKIPKNVTYKQSIQILNGAKIKSPSYIMPTDRDKIICVSEYVKKDWDVEDADVILNMTAIDKPKNTPLLLVSATRIDTIDKGGKRMIKFAKLLKEKGIPYIWLCFTNRPLPKDAPSELIRMEPTMDILPYIKKADYLVQLSESEGFCYSIVEALTVGTPVIVTPLEVIPEIGVVDGKNGYVLPFDLDQEIDLSMLWNIPTFKYNLNNTPSIMKWRKLLGDTTPTHSYKPEKKVLVIITQTYTDIILNKRLYPGDEVMMTKQRAQLIQSKQYGIIKEE